jgi:hypothetical protein
MSIIFLSLFRRQNRSDGTQVFSLANEANAIFINAGGAGGAFS